MASEAKVETPATDNTPGGTWAKAETKFTRYVFSTQSSRWPFQPTFAILASSPIYCPGNKREPDLKLTYLHCYSKNPSEYFDPCQDFADRSIKCMRRNAGDRDMCHDYFQ